MNCSDARSSSAVPAPQYCEVGPWVQWPLRHSPTRGDLRARDCFAVDGIAWPSISEPWISVGSEPLPQSSRILIATGIRAPRHFTAVQLKYIPGRGAQRGVVNRKSRRAPAGCAASRWSSGSQVAPTEGCETCSTPGMETKGQAANSTMPLTGGPGSLQTPTATRNSTPTSPLTAVPSSGRSAHPSDRVSR